MKGETSPHHSDALCIAQFHIHPGCFFWKACTCLFSGMKFQPVRDKYTLPPTNISYPKRETMEKNTSFHLGYRIPYFSDANYVCSMISTSFKGWYVEEVRRNIENMMLAAYLKWKKDQVSDFCSFRRLTSICLPILVDFFCFGRNNLPHTPPPDQTTLIIGIFRRCPPNCHQNPQEKDYSGISLPPSWFSKK